MVNDTRHARINVRLLALLAILSVILVVAVGTTHYVRKRSAATEALHAGRLAEQRKDWPEAARNLRLYLAAYPNDPLILKEYADAQLAVRPMRAPQMAGATQAYRRLLRFEPGSEWICDRLCRLYIAIGDYNQANYIARQRLAAEPADAAAMIWAGRSLLNQRLFDDAQQQVTEFVNRRKDVPALYGMLAEVAMQSTPPALPAATKWLDLGVKENPASPEAFAQRARFYAENRKDAAKARADLEAADKLAPQDPQVRVQLAAQWLPLKEWGRAKAELDAARNLPAPAAFLPFEQQNLRFRIFRLSADLALRSGDKQQGLSIARDGLAELTDTNRDAFVPDAIYLYLAGGDVEAARNLLDELHKAGGAAAGPGTDAGERLALLDAAVASFEHKPYRAIGYLEAVAAVGNPRSPEVWRRLAYAYAETRQDRRAIAAMDKYFAVQPDDGDAALDIARVCQRVGDWVGLNKYARLAQQHKPDDPAPAALLLSASLHGDSARLDEARADDIAQQLRAVEATHPANPELQLVGARLAVARGQEVNPTDLSAKITAGELPAAMELLEALRRQGKTDQAIALATRLMQLAPPGSELPIALADLQVAKGDTEAARKTLTEAAGRLSGAQKADIRRAFAHVLLNAGQSNEAITLLREMAAADPGDIQSRVALLQIPDIQKDARASQDLIDQIRTAEGETGLRWRVEQARLLMRDKGWKSNPQPVLDLLNRCTDGDAAWDTPVLLRGDAFEILGKDDQAETNYRQFVTQQPGNLPVLTRLLNLLERQGRYQAAARILERSPAASMLTGHSASIAIGRGDYKTAIQDLQTRITRDPQDAAARVLLAGLLFRNQHDPEAALKMLDEAQAANPGLPQILATRVEVLRSEGRDAEAVAHLNEAVQTRSDFAAYQQRAQFLLETGKLDEAERDFEKLTTFAASTADGYLALGDFYAKTGRPEKAIAAYEGGLRQAATNDALARALVRVQLASNVPDVRKRGLDRLNELLREKPRDEALLLMRADDLLNRGTLETSREAVDILENLVQANPHSAAAHQRLIRQAMNESNLSRAAQLAIRATGANPENADLALLRASVEAEMNHGVAARELAGAVLDIDPRNVPARNLITRLALKDGRIEEAEKFNSQALQMDAQDPEAHLLRSTVLEGRKQHAEAIQELDAFSRSAAGQHSAPVLLALAEMYCKEGEFQKCEALLKQADRIAPGEFGVFLVRAKLAAAQGNYGSLVSLLSTRLGERPSDGQAVTTIAALLVGGAAPDELKLAISLFDRYLRDNPDSVAGNLALAMVAYPLGDKARAEASYRRILGLEPYHREALNNLAWILSETPARLREALDYANRAVLRYPEDPSLLNTRGVIYFRLDQTSQARDDFQKCLTLSGISPGTRTRTLAWLGRISMQEGQRDQARTWYTQALELDKTARALNGAERTQLEEALGQPATRASTQ